MADLQKAIEIALEGHKGQVDKSDDIYILHPLRVMGSFKDADRRIVGVLHDVVEDTDFDLAALEQAGFSANVLAAVDAMTKREGEAYPEFIERVMRNEIARDVKLADIHDNMMRLPNLPEPRQSQLREKYEKARRQLESAAPI